MPRLHQVTRSDVRDEVVLAAYDRLFGVGKDPVSDPGTATGTPGNWWGVFALSPVVFRHAVAGFSLYQKTADHLSPALRELAQTRVGYSVGSQFVYSQHCKSCRAAGIAEEKIAAISHWEVSDLFDELERAVLAYADCLSGQQGRVSEGIFQVLQEHLDDSQILELTYITAMYTMHAVMSRALRLEYDDVDERVTEVAAPAGSEGRDIGADISGRGRVS